MARKSKPVEFDPAALEQRSRPSEDELRAVFDPASDIARQLREAEKRRAAASEARSAPVPPPANRGGKSQGGSDWVKLVLEDGKVKQVLKRRGYGGTAAVVDWINFTIGAETFDDDDCKISDDTITHQDDKLVPVTNEQVLTCYSRRLKAIFGFGVSHRLGYGQHFYQETWSMAEGWGTVSIGGQRDTILVSLSGTGLAAAKEGWELRLKTFLDQAARARITRVDLAHDDYSGATYSVDKADQDHTDGLYNCGGRNPRCEYRGDWKNPDGKGRSFYVGNRKNGKYCRVYEKGRELGDANSEWVRVEVEFKAVDRFIPFDVLLSPGAYLAAAYPAFAWIEAHQERIETTSKTCQANVDGAVKWLRHQCGAYVHHLVQLLGVDEFVRRVSRDDAEPAFMKVPHYGLAAKAIHEVFFPVHPVSLGAAASAW